ncbi:HvfC family RiPP maturation protein [Shewanella surugensis]|uniref:DNA-binding domain-containing protein n=1 Tax=Shewanella surugensis TaxID=212020 RepID=A0ABT0LCG2_9GAMM|nr:putative DNA-binding domain-containing protein [Shewanella surugensis]MCL1125378.1 putative DNA-binding domain-containing protein [Shewanella surugensis]
MSFIEVQQTFMDYIRDPSSPLPDGVKIERMGVYRELFFNNISSFVSNAFPVLKSLYSESQWLELVQYFFKYHDCQSPLFTEIAHEFLLFLQHEYVLEKTDPPFILELAHYEWLELVVSIEPDNPDQRLVGHDQIASAHLCLSASAKVAQYAYDVQHISPDYQPVSPAHHPQFFCVYRDENNEVNFFELTPLTAQLLGYLSQFESLTIQALYVWLTQTFTMMDPETLREGCLDMLMQLRSKGIICEYTGDI